MFNIYCIDKGISTQLFKKVSQKVMERYLLNHFELTLIIEAC